MSIDYYFNSLHYDQACKSDLSDRKYRFDVTDLLLASRNSNKN